MKKIAQYAFICLIAVIGFNVMAKTAAEIPVKDFFRSPEYSGMQLSPDGKFISFLAPTNNGTRNIFVMETANPQKIKALTGFNDENVTSYFWANNDDVVFTMDSDGMEALSILKVQNADDPKIVTLVGAKRTSNGTRTASIVHELPHDPAHILVQFNDRYIEYPDVYKVPLDSQWRSRRDSNSKMELVAKNPGDVQVWIIDNDGDVRGAISLNGLKAKFLYKEKDESEFKVLREYNELDEHITPLAFDFDNKTMFVMSNIGRDRNAIYKFDPLTNKLGELVFEHGRVDVSGLMMSRHQQKLLGIGYFDDYPESVYFDKNTEMMMNGFKKVFNGKQVGIASQSKDETLKILAVSDDTDPGNYYLFNQKTNKLAYIAPIMSWIKPELMSPMKPIHFNARDGMNLHGYLTLPKQTNGKKLPLIVNPHGGPFGPRDQWGYNPEHQFFASRGYATVQVNFRGSGGYGRNYEQAGYGGKWGGEMQNDITDTVNYLVKEGIVDPKRVCIYGASYGGYATMAGLTFTPELYACGINYVGVTDVGLLFTSMPKAWEPAKELMKVQIGDPDDKELMNRMSPVAHVDKIKAPLMIIQGAQDPRVVKQHATDLRDALEGRDIKLSDDEWIMKKDEGHGFRKEKNVIELYTKMEKFLAKHL